MFAATQSHSMEPNVQEPSEQRMSATEEVAEDDMECEETKEVAVEDDVQESEVEQQDEHHQGEEEHHQVEEEEAAQQVSQQDDGDASQMGANDRDSITGGRKRKVAPNQDCPRENKPRWHYGEKSFDDVNMKDVEVLVRRCNSLEKKLELNAEAANQLKELQNEKKVIEKQVMQTSGPEVVARTKACIAKQFLAQMMYVHVWNDELKSGRPVTAYLPNVSLELLTGLGGSVNNVVQKVSALYFDQPVSRPSPKMTRKDEQPAGKNLVLGQYVVLKFVKTSSMLEVTGTYKFGEAGKAAKCGEVLKATKGKGKGSKGMIKSAKKTHDEEEEGEEVVGADDEKEKPKLPTLADLKARLAMGGQ